MTISAGMNGPHQAFKPNALSVDDPPLTNNMIADAQAKGLKHVDLWGVAPEDQPDHKWAGFTAFKKSFGGRGIAYPGTWDLPVRKVRYGSYQLARKGAQLAKKLRARTRALANR